MSGKNRDYKKEDFIDDQNCDTCGLQILEIEHEETGVPRIESKKSICLIRSQIAYFHEQILGFAEYDNIAKPKVSLSIDNEFFASKAFKDLQKEHISLLKVFFDPEAYEPKSLPNLKAIDEVNFVYVETTEKLLVAFDELLKCKEIAVNLEYYSQRSYKGFTWLLQISTEDTYYMINCLKLQKELHILNAIFMDINILKIFHYGENAVLRLYKDFGILVTNMFDTAILRSIIIASKKKEFLWKNISFEISPVHTHFLIFLKKYLVNFSIKLHKKFLKTMRQRCISVCKQVYNKVNWGKLNLVKLLSDKATNQDRYVAIELLKWRDAIAHKEDESPNFILPDNVIFKIARELLFHRNSITLTKCYGAKFLNNKNTYFNIREVVVAAKRISNRGKKFKTFLDYRYQRYFEAKSKSKDSKHHERSSKNSETTKPKKSHSVKKTAKNLHVCKIPMLSQVGYLVEESLLKILKPQTCFKDVDDNNSAIWKPRLTTKPNALEPLDLHIEHQGSKTRYCHPYKTELESFVVPRSQLLEQTPIEFKTLKETPLHVVQTEHQLQNMLSDLKKCSQIAVDLKYNEERSYSGYTCLLLISTRDSDYIVDALSLRSELHILNEIFTDPTVLKVFHDSVKKMIWLQKDFSLYIINMYDIARTTIRNNKKVIGLPYLKKWYCKIPLKKIKQIELSSAEKDWRVRPLSFRVKHYLRLCTHQLLYMKDVLSNELFFYPKQLKKFYEYCTDLCKNVYCKPFYRKNSYKDILERKLVKQKYAGHTVRIRVMKELHKLRNNIAQKEDENPEFVMQDPTLLKLVDLLPIDEQKIADLWNYHKARNYLPTIREIISSARKLKVSLKNDNGNKYIFEMENQMKGKDKNKRPVKNYINREKQDVHVTLADFLCNNKAVENGVMHLERSDVRLQVKERKSHYNLKKNTSFVLVKGKYWNESQTIESWVLNWIHPYHENRLGKFEVKQIKKDTWKIALEKKFKKIIWNKRYLIHYLEGTLISRALTEEEQKVQQTLLNIGKEMERNGFQVKIGDIGIKIEDKWYEWKAEGGLREISEEEAWEKEIDVDLYKS